MYVCMYGRLGVSANLSPVRNIWDPGSRTPNISVGARELTVVTADQDFAHLPVTVRKILSDLHDNIVQNCIWQVTLKTISRRKNQRRHRSPMLTLRLTAK